MGRAGFSMEAAVGHVRRRPSPGTVRLRHLFSGPRPACGIGRTGKEKRGLPYGAQQEPPLASQEMAPYWSRYGTSSLPMKFS